MTDFAADISRIVNLTQEKLKKFERGVVIGIGESLVDRSPVGDPTNWAESTPVPPGYVGGRFIANWQYGLGSAPSGDLPDIDASGNASRERIMAGVASIAQPGNIHYVVNNLPYAQALEDGWSNQAPEGMVRLTMIAAQTIINTAVRELSR